MKKIIVILFVITLGNIILNNKKQVIIPNTAIRFRIIANSNNTEDQKLKKTIKKDIEPELMEQLINSTSYEEAKYNIKKTIPNIDEKLKKYNTPYTINYGNNYFPEKEYKGVVYPEGDYESLVITLGNGLGDNWWCVLFPPLCLLEAEESENKNIEYKFYVQEIIDKYMN